MLGCVVGLTVSGLLATRQRFADDEVPGWASGRHCDDVLEVAGAEPPAAVHVTGDWR